VKIRDILHFEVKIRDILHLLARTLTERVVQPDMLATVNLTRMGRGKIKVIKLAALNLYQSNLYRSEQVTPKSTNLITVMKSHNL